jgi:Uma2 family endonuclease
MRADVGGKVRYPDICVCAGRIPDTVRMLHDAVVIFDVLSDETAEIDRDEKRLDYARLPGIRHDVLLEPTKLAVIVVERFGDRWNETIVTSGVIGLPALGIELPVDAVYRGLDLDNQIAKNRL